MAKSKRNKAEAEILISEKNFEQLVKEVARVNNWLYYHTYRSIHSVPGFPDCVFVRGKRTVYAELKTEKGKVTPSQQQWLDALADAGNEVYLWRPSDFEEICEVLTSIDKEALRIYYKEKIKETR